MTSSALGEAKSDKRRRALALLAYAAAIGALWLAVRIATDPYSARLLASQLFSNGPEVLQVRSVRELEQRYDALGYRWPPKDRSEVPAVVVAELPPDFAGIEDSVRRKALFLRIMLPIVLAENDRLREQRELVELFFSDRLPDPDSAAGRWLRAVADAHGVTGQLGNPAEQQKLLRRLDEIPPELVLAQAAIESGWGTSRFALQGNSLFGQWTYDQDAGLVPQARKVGARHLIRRYDNLSDSVRSYMQNLNSNEAYGGLRLLRAAMRNNGQTLDSRRLAQGLKLYSERGEAYVHDVRNLIGRNNLTVLRAL